MNILLTKYHARYRTSLHRLLAPTIAAFLSLAFQPKIHTTARQMAYVSSGTKTKVAMNPRGSGGRAPSSSGALPVLVLLVFAVLALLLLLLSSL